MESFYHLVGEDAGPIAWWQMSIRAVIIFAFALMLYRLMPRRAFGGNGAVDIVVVVLMGSNLSRALTGNAPLLAAMAATATLAALYSILAMLAWRIDPLSRLVKGRPIQLIRDGEIDRKALRRAQLGERDLEESMRLDGVTDIGDVAAAYLERNGEITVIRKRRGQ